MKKAFLFFTVIILLSSCSSMRQANTRVFTMDFNPYIERGYFFTELETVPFDYIPVGIVNVSMESGAGEGKNNIIQYTYSQALDVLCEELDKLGANGVINLEIKHTPVTLGKNMYGELIQSVDCSVSGMAFKRK